MCSDSTVSYRALLLASCWTLLLPDALYAEPTALVIQPNTCVMLPDEAHCQLTVNISAVPASIHQLCLSKPPQQPTCQPWHAEKQPVQLELNLQQNTLLQLLDGQEQVQAEGWINVVLYQPATRYRRKRGLGWNLL